MSQQWTFVPLRDVLTQMERKETVDPGRDYMLLGVRLEGRGPFVRETIPGARSAATKLARVEYGDFIYSRLFAWRGAFGVIPRQLAGCYVSNEFPTFVPKKDRVDVQFLNLWFRLKPTVEAVAERCSGSTPLTRNRFKEEHFNALQIPLPSLEEQRRIVAKIEALAGKIEEAKGLHKEVDQRLGELCRSVLHEDADGANRPTLMEELVHLREPDVEVKADETYHFAGVYCFGEGVFAGQRKTGMEFKYSRLTRLKAGNFLYPKLMAWEGALGIVPRECHGLVVSTEFPVFEINTDRVLPEVLDVHFRTPSVWPELSGASTGTNVRRRRLNPADFLRYKFPLPPISRQQRLREIALKAREVREQQGPACKELDALLPAILDRAFKGEL